MGEGAAQGPPGPGRRQATVLESVEQIREMRRAASPKTVALPNSTPGQGQGPPAEAPAGARMYRPTLRPPMALLHVLDDGEETGEVVRIRAGSFAIGRVQGDLVIPHDDGISGRHAEIVRRLEGGAWTWTLRDLKSTNGTFVRASTVALSDGQELLIGGVLFRFEAPAPAPGPAEAPAPDACATRKWEGLSRPDPGSPSEAPAALVEIADSGRARRFALTPGEHLVGSDPRRCSIAIEHPTVEPRHARISRDERGRWTIANERSRNGVWARVREAGLGRGGAFQCGEQRFLFKVL